jgi:hypothetical protein
VEVRSRPRTNAVVGKFAMWAHVAEGNVFPTCLDCIAVMVTFVSVVLIFYGNT